MKSNSASARDVRKISAATVSPPHIALAVAMTSTTSTTTAITAGIAALFRNARAATKRCAIHAFLTAALAAKHFALIVVVDVPIVGRVSVPAARRSSRVIVAKNLFVFDVRPRSFRTSPLFARVALHHERRDFKSAGFLCCHITASPTLPKTFRMLCGTAASRSSPRCPGRSAGCCCPGNFPQSCPTLPSSSRSVASPTD